MKGTTSNVMVVSKPRVNFDKMTAPVPEIMDGSVCVCVCVCVCVSLSLSSPPHKIILPNGVCTVYGASITELH
jgi:hypothetical protein